ncbi:hypothetical protein [Prosthecomicrobium hirschii]|uniref:hypothetical protein n=1 Tax=Prosthecodimorpha hirschii TaxID=665126 RepID=UPI00221E3848|nr:hypothetical protein [Prosthecomicrobium hirschii]MCW1839468.1 hypothetical protein [Prosthecomicrobium hirschii]
MSADTPSAEPTDALEAQMLPLVADLIDTARRHITAGLDPEAVGAVFRVIGARIDVDPITFGRWARGTVETAGGPSA